MKHLFLLALFGIQSFAYAQFIERDAYFSAAGHYADIGTLKLQSNIGELMSATYSDLTQSMLTQGFVQPEQPVITGLSPKAPGISASVYPNPVSGTLFIQLNTADPTSVKIEVYDVLGKLLLSQTGNDAKAGQNTYSLDLEKFIPGIYFVRIASSENKFSTSYKVNKI